MDSNDDPISLSFIDCISCGLAAALFLFLVFAVLPRSAAFVETQIVEGAGAGNSRNTAANGLPPLFVGIGSNVPVDIRIDLGNNTVAEGEYEWRDVPPGGSSISVYKPKPGRASAFLGTFRSVDRAPKFYLKNTLPRRSISGTITIKAGGDTAFEIAFECPASPAAGNIQVLTFESGDLTSSCII